MAEVAQGDTGNLIFRSTSRSGYSAKNHYTRPVKKKKTPVSTINRKQWYKKKKKKNSGHTKQQKKRVFFCLLFPFFTHIYIYTKASRHFQCVHMNGRQNADAAIFFRLSCSPLLNWHFTDKGRLLGEKKDRKQKRLICQICAWHRNVRANTSQGTDSTFTLCTDTRRLPLQSCVIIPHCNQKKKWGGGASCAVPGPLTRSITFWL